MKKTNFKNKGFAWAIVALGAAIIGGLFIHRWFPGGLTGLVLDILNFFAGIVVWMTDLFFRILSQIAATIINVFIVLNPFGEYGFASIVWEFFKNIAYVLLVFLALIAGFEWIINREDEAKRLLFGVLIIAFLINFTFILAKEIFIAVWYLQIGILQSANLYKNETSELGNLIYAALSTVPPKEIAAQIDEKIAPSIAQEAQEGGPGTIHNLEAAITLAGRLLGIFLNVIYSLIMWVFAGIAIGRFLIISFLAGLLPLACIAYVTPWYKSRWDQWWRMFLTWNFNILILIILILIGISLIATTGAFNELNLQKLFVSDTPAAKTLGNLLGDAAVLLAIIIKFVFIGAYFLFVLYIALQIGGRAADYGYRFGKWLWGLAGAAALWPGRKIGEFAGDKLGGKLEELGDRLALSRFFLARELGGRLKGLGSSLRKPAKQKLEEQAKAIWNQIQDKSPEEIAQIIQRYSPELQKEIAKLAERDKNADEIIQIASNLSNLQDAAKKGILKNLCGRTLNCNLTRLVTGTQEEKIVALNQIASRMGWQTANLNHLSSILSKVGIGDPNQQAFLFTNMYAYVQDKRNFWSQENIAWLHNNKREDFINANIQQIKATPAYRAVVIVGAAELAQILGGGQQEIKEVLEESFIKGEVESLLSNPKELIQKVKQKNSQLQIPDFDSMDANMKNQINTILSKLRGALKTPLPSSSEEDILRRLRHIEERLPDQSSSSSSSP